MKEFVTAATAKNVKFRRFKPPTSENEETKSESWHDVMVRG